MNGPMVSLLPREDTTILKLRGNSRADAARLLLEQLLESPISQNVAVDWEQAEHVDACMLQVLLALRNCLVQQGLSLSVTMDNPAVREYLRLAGLSEFFPVHSGPPPLFTEVADG